MGKIYQVGCKEMDAEGRGIVRFNNAQFAVPYLLDGEKAGISLVYGKNKTGAKVESITKASPDRVTPACSCYGSCGGCTLMHASYEKQLAIKRNIVEACMKKVPGIHKLPGGVRPVLGMEGDALHYRSKVHATFGRDRRGQIITGLYEEFSHHLVPFEACAIEHKAAAGIVKTIREFAQKKKLSVYSERTESGLLRHVLLRFAANGDAMVVIVAADPVFPEKHQLANAITRAHKEVKTVVLNINPGKTNMVLGKREEVLFGDGSIIDDLLGLRFRISPQSFYQINHEQTEQLYGMALQLAELKPGDVVMDAYCGTGTIALLAAKSQPEAQILGVELNADAVRDAKANQTRNHVENARFVNADAGAYMEAMAKNKDKLDVLFMDPPRSGSNPAFLQAVKKLAPKKIVYVSCDPTTLARDLCLLTQKYQIRCVQPVDMFPQTTKVETVVLLSREKTDGYV